MLRAVDGHSHLQVCLGGVFERLDVKSCSKKKDFHGTKWQNNKERCNSDRYRFIDLLCHLHQMILLCSCCSGRNVLGSKSSLFCENRGGIKRRRRPIIIGNCSLSALLLQRIDECGRRMSWQVSEWLRGHLTASPSRRLFNNDFVSFGRSDLASCSSD